MAKIRIIQVSETEKQLQILCPGCNELHAMDMGFYFNGDFDRPTINPSLLVRGWLNEKITQGVCHSFITDGKIQFLDDCSHELKNKTVELPEID